ncbi:MAG: Winged helix-turn-helix protein [Cenarchaeum symbiont of Oopsacas minuta]|nr:Winged helix-turn-helix protein [Cenarchaeum symbiont of Oopsacas minuta]
MMIVADLLSLTKNSGMDGIKPTTLLVKANLSHSRLSKLTTNLIGAGLLTKITYDGKNTFVITERGSTYLEQYEKFVDIAESFGLEM